jgi:hypothetical protein
VTSNGRGGRRYLPYAFTEQGVAQLSTVLRSRRAIDVNIEIVRVFVRLRQLVASDADLARRLDDLERKYAVHDVEILKILEAIRQLMLPPVNRARVDWASPPLHPSATIRTTFKPGPVRPARAPALVRRSTRLRRARLGRFFMPARDPTEGQGHE